MTLEQASTIRDKFKEKKLCRWSCNVLHQNREGEHYSVLFDSLGHDTSYTSSDYKLTLTFLERCVK